jgi:retron-type reverse transcriptase
MTNRTLQDVFGNDPDSIITIVGKNYKELVYNLELVFPGKGIYIAKQLAGNRQDSLYRNFDVYKKRGNSKKPRKIFAPVNILKRLQKILVRFAEQQFENHPCSHGFVRDRSTRTAAEQIKAVDNINEKELTNIDIEGAFPAVTGKAIRNLLRQVTSRKLTPWQINIISKIACTSRDVLATGAPSSPILFNWRLTAVDFELERAFMNRNWQFVRYADDISVVHFRTQKKEVIELVMRILKRFDLKIARNKLKTFRGTLKRIVGINLQFNYLSIPRKIRRTARAVTHQLRDKGLVSGNSFHKGMARFNLKKLESKTNLAKGSLEAAAAGFMAYVIHIERLLIKAVPEDMLHFYLRLSDEDRKVWESKYFRFVNS